MGTKSRDRLYGTSVRIAAERAAEARRQADKLACDAWSKHTQLIDRASAHQDFGERSAVNMVAGGAVNTTRLMGEDNGAVC